LAASSGRGGFYGGGPGMVPGAKKNEKESELGQGSLACAELAIEQSKGHATQIAKELLFNAPAPKKASTATAAAAPADTKANA